MCGGAGITSSDVAGADSDGEGAQRERRAPLLVLPEEPDAEEEDAATSRTAGQGPRVSIKEEAGAGGGGGGGGEMVLDIPGESVDVGGGGRGFYGALARSPSGALRSPGYMQNRKVRSVFLFILHSQPLPRSSPHLPVCARSSFFSFMLSSPFSPPKSLSLHRDVLGLPSRACARGAHGRGQQQRGGGGGVGGARAGARRLRRRGRLSSE